jgi:hypothetical protein
MELLINGCAAAPPVPGRRLAQARRHRGVARHQAHEPRAAVLCGVAAGFGLVLG